MSQHKKQRLEKPPAARHRHTPPRRRALAAERQPVPAAPLFTPAPDGTEAWIGVEAEWGFDPRRQGARWLPSRSCWVAPAGNLAPDLEARRALPWSWAWWAAQTLNRDPESIDELTPSWSPRPHQVAAMAAMDAARAAGYPGFALADDMGLGKTLSAWAWALRQPDLDTILIATTLATLPHWRRTIQHAGWHGKRVLLLNHERLQKVMRLSDQVELSSKTKGRRRRLADQAAPLAFDLFILDEAHRAKNPTSAIGVLARRLAAAARFTLWLSGTIGSRPLDLAYLAPLLVHRAEGRAIPVDDLAAFGAWCRDQEWGVRRGAFGAWEQDTPERVTADEHALQAAQKGGLTQTQRADLAARRAAALTAEARLHRVLFRLGPGGEPPLALRRLPADIAGWPTLRRSLWPQDLPASSSAVAAAATAWRRWRELSPQDRAAAPALTAWRQAASLARADATADLVGELRESGYAVAISVAFLATVDRLAALLRKAGQTVAVLDGRAADPVHREMERLRFQRDVAGVVVFTLAEGISLHQGETPDAAAPRILLIHDIRWSAIQQAQIEARTHRDGADAPVRWLFGAATPEATVARRVLEAYARMQTLHGDDGHLTAALLAELRAVG